MENAKRRIQKSQSLAVCTEDQGWRCIREHWDILERVYNGHVETEEEKKIAQLAAGLIRLKLLQDGLSEMTAQPGK